MSDKIIEMKQEQARIVSEMRRIDEAAEERGGEMRLTAEEQQEFDTLTESHVALNEGIRRKEQVRDASRAADAHANALDGSALGHDNESRAAAEGMRAYNDAFDVYIRKGEARMTPEQRDILDRGARTEERADMSTTTTVGGFTVPQSFSDRMFSLKIQAGGVRKTNVTVFKTGDGRDFPVPVATAHGAAEWLAEAVGAAITAETFGQVTLKAYVADRLARLSQQLLQDSAFDLQSYLAGIAAQKIGRLQNAAFINGDGSGKPTGMAAAGGAPVAAAGVTVTEVEYALAAGPSSDEIMTSYFALNPAYRDNGQWLLSDSMIRVISTLKSTTGQYLFIPSLREDEKQTLLGKEVINDPDLEATGADDKVVGFFADFQNFYAIRDVNELNVVRLNELYANSLQVGFLMWQRVDGHVIDAAAGIQLTTGAG